MNYGIDIFEDEASDVRPQGPSLLRKIAGKLLRILGTLWRRPR